MNFHDPMDNVARRFEKACLRAGALNVLMTTTRIEVTWPSKVLAAECADRMRIRMGLQVNYFEGENEHVVTAQSVAMKARETQENAALGARLKSQGALN